MGVFTIQKLRKIKHTAIELRNDWNGTVPSSFVDSDERHKIRYKFQSNWSHLVYWLSLRFLRALKKENDPSFKHIHEIYSSFNKLIDRFKSYQVYADKSWQKGLVDSKEIRKYLETTREMILVGDKLLDSIITDIEMRLDLETAAA